MEQSLDTVPGIKESYTFPNILSKFLTLKRPMKKTLNKNFNGFTRATGYPLIPTLLGFIKRPNSEIWKLSSHGKFNRSPR